MHFARTLVIRQLSLVRLFIVLALTLTITLLPAQTTTAQITTCPEDVSGNLDSTTNTHLDSNIEVPAGTTVTVSFTTIDPDTGGIVEVVQWDGVSPQVILAQQTNNSGVAGVTTSVSYTFATDTTDVLAGVDTYGLILDLSGTFRSTFSITWSCNENGNGGQPLPTPDAPAPWDPGDGRLNPFPAERVAVYLQDGQLQVYVLNDAGQGTETLSLPSAEVLAACDPAPAANTLIASAEDGRVRLYCLSTGEVQLNVNHGLYEAVYVWDTLPPSVEVIYTFNAAGEVLSRFVKYF
jgi:hypothetical protein